MKRETLTEAQVDFLSLLDQLRSEFGSRHHCMPSPTANAVVKRGLATIERFENPKIRTAVFTITPAGRQALADREAQDHDQR